MKIKILAVDLDNVYRAAWESHAGKNEQGAEAFRSALAQVMRARDGFDRVAVCCDSGPSFRKTIEPAYKAHRVAPPAAYAEQRRRMIERLAADGATVIHAPAVPMSADVGPEPHYAESDDVIAALCSWADTSGAVEHVRILGSDKDLLALVNDGGGADEDVKIKIDVQRLDGAKRGADGTVEHVPGAVMDAAAVVEKIGIPPSKVPDWLALAGDGSDNFKPFPGELNDKTKRRGPGIGDKTAVRLLQAFGTVTGIFDAIEDEAIGEHERKILATHGLNAGLRGLALATLRWDLPIDFSPLLAEPVTKPAAEPATYFERAAEPRNPLEDGRAERAVEQALAAAGTPARVEITPERPRPAPAPTVAAEPVTASAMVLARPEPRTGIDVYALQPRTLDSLWDTAQALHNSRLYPQFSNPEGIMAVAIEANERGIPVGAALRNAYVVSGRPAWSASFMAGQVLVSGKAEFFEIVESTPERATLAYKRVGRPEGRFTFTIEEAQRAGWVKGGNKWATNPRTMLRWAAMREAARAFFPDVVAGMHTPDELRNGHVTDAEWDAEDAA
jgi:5'-3' exonuclease